MEEIRLLTKYRELVELHQQLNCQLSVMMDEQSQLLTEEIDIGCNP